MHYYLDIHSNPCYGFLFWQNVTYIISFNIIRGNTRWNQIKEMVTIIQLTLMIKLILKSFIGKRYYNAVQTKFYQLQCTSQFFLSCCFNSSSSISIFLFSNHGFLPMFFTHISFIYDLFQILPMLHIYTYKHAYLRFPEWKRY